MVEARQKDHWDHTAAVCTWIHNVNCTKRQDQIKNPDTLNPFRRGQRRGRSTMSMKDKMAGFKVIALGGRPPRSKHRGR